MNLHHSPCAGQTKGTVNCASLDLFWRTMSTNTCALANVRRAITGSAGPSAKKQIDDIR